MCIRDRKKGYDYQILPPELRFSKEEAEELLDFLRNKSERLFVYTGLVYTCLLYTSRCV